MLLQGQIEKNKEMFLNEVRHAVGFMHLLMKERNAGGKWTGPEREQLKNYIRRLMTYVPVFCVFLLPGGFFLIPLLAEVMDRRRRIRSLPRRPGESETSAHGAL
jgi:hypothetical protein